MRPRSIGLALKSAGGGKFRHQFAEGGILVLLHVDEEERGRAIGHLVLHLRLHADLNERHGGEQGQPQTQRHDHRHRRRAGAREIAEREPRNLRAAVGNAREKRGAMRHPPARNSANTAAAPPRKTRLNQG